MKIGFPGFSFTRSTLFALLAVLAGLTGVANSAERPMVDAAGRTVALPAKPQRVLALSELDLDSLLALKIKPIGATRGRGQTAVPAYLGAAATAIPSVGNFASPVLDLVIMLQPDLILAGGISNRELLDQLNKIAPTVVTYKPGEHWQSAFRRVASIVVQPAAAESFLTDYQRRAATLRDRLDVQGLQANATVSVVRWNPQGPAYMLKDAFASMVLADLKLRRPVAQQQPGAAHSAPLSLEALALIDADWLFVGTLNSSGQANNALKAASISPAFRQLNAVKKNHMRAVDGALWTSPGGPLAALAILADVEKSMLKQ